MCFTIEIHKTRIEIETRFNRRFEHASEEFEPTYYHSAFDFPRIPVITQEKPSNLTLLNWGLVPSWLKDADRIAEFKISTLNAKAETLSEKPSFRKPLQNKRCLVIAHGFFEWQHNGKVKVPYYIKMKDDSLFTFAGLYDEWVNIETGEIYNGLSIITCKANSLLERIHNSKKRMPVIFSKNQEEAWIDGNLNVENIRLLLKPIEDSELEAWPIGDLINSKNKNKNVSELIERRGNSNYSDQMKLL